MYSIISPIKKDINVPIETNKLSLSPNDSMKIENVNEYYGYFYTTCPD